MKKIILSVLSVLMIFSLIGCSGVLHDEKPFVPEKVTIEGGSWFYFDITVWGDNDGNTAQLIINGDSVQSPDTKLPAFEAKTGAALYFTMKKSDLKLNVSYQDDEPAYTPVPGTVRIYVYTDLTSANAYYWDGNFAGPAWPGNAMVKMGEKSPSIYIDGCKVINITTEATDGNVIYFMEGWVPGNTWNTAGTCLAPVINGSAVYTFPEPYETFTTALKVQPRVLTDTSNLWDGVGAKINDAGDYTSVNEVALDGKHYYWVLDCADDYTAKLVVVE